MLVFYFLVLFLSLNISSWWWMWLSFETLNWILVIFMKSNFILMFLILQSLMSLFIIFSLIYAKKFLIIFLMIKMGLPPFHYWLVWNISKWSLLSFFIFIFMHKWTPCVIFLNYSKSFWIFVVFMLTSFLLFWATSNFKKFFLGISINDMGWMLFSWLASLKIFFFYLMINLFSFLMVILLNYYLSGNDFLLFFVFLMNMPPFVSFLIKWSILIKMNMVLGVLSLMSSWLLLVMIWFWVSMLIIFVKMSENNTMKIVMPMIIILILWV